MEPNNFNFLFCSYIKELDNCFSGIALSAFWTSLWVRSEFAGGRVPPQKTKNAKRALLESPSRLPEGGALLAPADHRLVRGVPQRLTP